MFKQGDYVIYSCQGVCLIDGIKEKITDNEKKMYYILHPIHVANSKIMTPIGNRKVMMRSVMEPEKAENIIATLLDSNAPRILDKKLRERAYTKMLREGNPSELVEIINALIIEENEKRVEGKKNSATDEKFLEKAKQLLVNELSISLGIEVEQIKSRVEGILQERI